jgi:CHAT domain-containing protein/tetratricopeptide (TPR) repeat protein
MLDGVHDGAVDVRALGNRERERVRPTVMAYHYKSIYRGPAATQRDRSVQHACPFPGAFLMLLLPLMPAVGFGANPAPGAACSAALASLQPIVRQHLVTIGTNAAEAIVAVPPGRQWLIEAREQGNDATVEVRDRMDQLLAQADHPERRTGTRRLLIPAGDRESLLLRVTGKEHPGVSGTVEIAVFDFSLLAKYPACVRSLQSLAAADADYAIAQQISRGRLTTAKQSAHDAYLRAAREYLAAEAGLDHPADATLRGEAALALAGVDYFDLQDWRQSAEWTRIAEGLFERRDAYRLARAQALGAAAWIEVAMDAGPHGVAAGGDSDPKELLAKARDLLYHVFSFHQRRHERYDAALQINNIGLAYYYEGRFPECISAMRAASRLFGELGETPRQALASQNRALCYWGIGQLPEALGAFTRALQEMSPDAYPQLYLATLNNTGLINFVLGHFDESLRLHGRALELATRLQNRREEAQGLYGIGVTYYALGDRDQAGEYLARALEIRTAAFDGRGRRVTLRALATVYADAGEYSKAIESDQEALALATAPTSIALSRISLAVHTALAGDGAQALDMLSALIKLGPVADPLITAQARLARAGILRQSGAYAGALLDLAAAAPVFAKVGSVTDGFAADLERARSLQLAHRPTAALAAIEDALKKSDAIRTQTANPEFRAQLQLPLRAAYDLKLDLLWQRFDLLQKAGKTGAAARIAAVAFRSADAGRARSLADIAGQQYSGEVRRALAPQFARRENLYRDLAGLRFALDSRLDPLGSADLKAQHLESEIAERQRQVDTLNSAIAARNSTNRAAGAAVPLPADAAIIAYWVGAQSSYGWAVTPAGIHWVRLADSATITSAARDFHDALQRLADLPRERRFATDAQLSAAILRPVAAWAAPYRRWFFIPDAALNYVPFAALRSDSGGDTEYIVMTHDIALAPSAWMLLAQARAPQPAVSGRLLLVSDPVYELTDPRLNLKGPLDATPPAKIGYLGGGPSYARLPGTAREANAIQGEFRSADVDAFSGLQATRERLLQLDWSQYRYIHIASHGHIDARMPQLSALLLSAYDERGEPIEEALRAADLATLTLAADVVVFSGCDTALGKEVLSEGMVGIAQSTLARGAGAVVASLWPVPDEIGANLMTEFYQHLVRDSMNPVTALSASKRSVLNRNPSADPALWAAFQVSVATITRLGPAAAKPLEQPRQQKGSP